jgi:ribosomal protein L32
MGWLKKDDRYAEHRKIRRLGDGPYRLHDTALLACAKDETDGLVTEDDIADMQHGERLRKYVPSLVEAGLWHEVTPDSWVIHGYLDYNPSRVENELKRDQARARQERWRKSRTETDESRDNGGVSNALVADTSHYPVPSRPVPSRPLKETGQVGGGKSPKQDTGNNAPDIQPCGKAHDPDDACRACGTARKQAEADQITAKRDQRSTEAKKRARVAHAAITACNFCNAKGYTPGGKPCRHDLDDEVES